MRTLVAASLSVLMLMCATTVNARAGEWRDLRIDASSDSRLTESVQQMRDVLPYNRAVLFVLTLKDLKTRFSPAEYREHLNGLTYKQIVQLGSPNVSNEYLAYYSRLREKDLRDTTGVSTFAGFTGDPGFNPTTGRQLPAP